MIKILFAGSPEPAAVTLQRLIEKSKGIAPSAAEQLFEITGVLTNAPAPQGRHKELVPTPVAVLSEQNNIPVLSPEKLDSSVREQVASLNPDMLVCFAYGHIFGPKFLSLFKFGGINLHPSLLPKYRGCTPVNAAILNRDSETAFTIQTLSLGMDEGNILAQEKVSLNGTETAGSLLNQAAERGAQLIYDLICDAARNGKLPEGQPQQGEVSYTGIIKKEDTLIDWAKSAAEIDAQIRAYNPAPVAFTYMNEGKESLKIIEASLFTQDYDAEKLSGAKCGQVLECKKPFGILIKCGKGILCVTKLQKQQKNAMGWKDFMNGSRNFEGSVLG